MLRTAVLHVQSAQRAEVNAGDILAAIMQQDKSQAAVLLSAHGVTRLDILDYISHGISKVPRTPGPIDVTGSPPCQLRCEEMRPTDGGDTQLCRPRNRLMDPSCPIDR